MSDTPRAIRAQLAELQATADPRALRGLVLDLVDSIWARSTDARLGLRAAARQPEPSETQETEGDDH
jgi:hypothetical protein